MTGALSVSVVIVSRDRPESLRLTLLGVSQLRYDPFEVILVTDGVGRAMARSLPQAANIKIVPFDSPGISQARNLGIAQAAGDIVAFIDDDAVPQPSWLTYLCAPFQDPEVAAVGGFVRGRNGISWQWRARSVNALGETADIQIDGDEPAAFETAPGNALKIEGTNMAVRRHVLQDLGGFDEAFTFFLDETDLNLRLAAKGAVVAIAPMARVQHGFAPSTQRRADRVPRDLFDIGASWAVFLRQHCPQDQQETAWRAAHREQRRRVLRHMVAGLLEPRDVRHLLSRLEQGFEQGAKRASRYGDFSQANAVFQRFPTNASARSVVLSGWRWRLRRLRRRAVREVAAGNIATVFCFSLSARFHSDTFQLDGYWLQSGGVYGKSDRSDSLMMFWWFRTRLKRELKRVQLERLID